MPHSHVSLCRIALRPLAGAQGVGFPLPRPARPADGRTVLSDWLELWLDAEIEPRRAETTVNGYRNIIRNHMIPAPGAVRLSDLTPELINGYYRWLADEKGLSPNTVRKHHILLHTALKSAYRQGVLPVNPALRATPPPPVTVGVVYYTPARLGRLLKEVRGLPPELPVKLACHLGLRRSEVLGLRWRDVDLQAGLLSVCRVRTTVGARVPMYQISRAMGHSDPSITQRIYTHLFDQTHGEVLTAVAHTIVSATSA